MKHGDLVDPKSLTPVTWDKGWNANGCIPLQDAIRAYRDRPSMEAELTALRERNQELTDKLRGDMVWIEDLRAEVERLKKDWKAVNEDCDLIQEANKHFAEDNGHLHAEVERLRGALRDVKATLISIIGIREVDKYAGMWKMACLEIDGIVTTALNEKGD
jgi:predicted nuclease with TOPRIM domain